MKSYTSTKTVNNDVCVSSYFNLKYSLAKKIASPIRLFKYIRSTRLILKAYIAPAGSPIPALDYPFELDQIFG